MHPSKIKLAISIVIAAFIGAIFPNPHHILCAVAGVLVAIHLYHFQTLSHALTRLEYVANLLLLIGAYICVSFMDHYPLLEVYLIGLLAGGVGACVVKIIDKVITHHRTQN